MNKEDLGKTLLDGFMNELKNEFNEVTKIPFNNTIKEYYIITIERLNELNNSIYKHTLAIDISPVEYLIKHPDTILLYSLQITEEEFNKM